MAISKIGSNSVNLASGLDITDGDITVASGHGLSFAAANNASGMSSELLDDYEVGTWTAAFSVASGSITINSSYDTGQYVKVGPLVYFNIHCRVSSVSSPSGKLDVTGFPFNFGNNGTERCRVTTAVWAYIPGSGLTAGDSFQTLGTEDTANLTIHMGNKANTNYYGEAGNRVASGTEFSLTGVYTATI